MMRTLFLFLAVTVVAADESARAPRKASAIAPSLPELTREEEQKIEAVLDRFIRADIGRLGGAAASAAKRDFDKLGPEAIPAMIRGLNRSARQGHSCPVLLISKKLDRLLSASRDAVLLEFARDEIGAGLGRTKYSGTLEDLRFKCLLRKNALARLTPPPVKGLAALNTAELVKAASTQRGPRLKAVLTELGKRDGKEALAGLAVAAASYDDETRQLGRRLLDGSLGRMPASSLADRFDDGSAEVRMSAIRVAAGKHTRLVTRIIARLTDDDDAVRAAARQALKRIGKGEDFGPPPTATREQQRQAQAKWQAWWDSQQP